VWQVLYDELHPRGFEMIAVALDTATEAVEKNIDRTQEQVDALEDLHGPIMGWGPEEWMSKRPPTFPCLIDEEHRLTDLYGIDNVPIAVWIDEQGRIVRPNENPGHGDWVRRLDRETFLGPEDDLEIMIANRRTYWNALRDWVDKGAESQFV
jgi:hypothetical protein